MKLPATIKPQWILYGVGIGAGLLLLNSLAKGKLFTSAARTVTGAPVDIVIGAGEGIFGLPDPRTPASQTACAKAQAEGRDWDASFVCPASQTIKGWFDREFF